jgi:hypothetical protein
LQSVLWQWACFALFPRELLDHFELPNTLEAVRLTAPDGRVFIVSSSIERVQRYGPEGFEKGFLVGKKVSTSAMSASGNVLLSRREMLTYTPDGAEVPPSGSCRDRLEGSYSSYPSDAQVPTIAFNWFSALAVPLWHPVVAWFIALFGGCLFEATHRDDGFRIPDRTK